MMYMTSAIKATVIHILNSSRYLTVKNIGSVLGCPKLAASQQRQNEGWGLPSAQRAA